MFSKIRTISVKKIRTSCKILHPVLTDMDRVETTTSPPTAKNIGDINPAPSKNLAGFPSLATKETKGNAFRSTRTGELSLNICNGNGDLFKIPFSPFSKLSKLEDLIKSMMNYSSDRKINIFYKFRKIPSSHTLLHYGLRTSVKLFFTTEVNKKRISTAKKAVRIKASVKPFGCIYKKEKIKDLFEDASRGLKSGNQPELALSGTGGTYLIYGPFKECLAVFKPQDEEPYAPNNPRVHVGPFDTRSIKPGLYSGSGAIREVAAWVLDQDGFAGVPETTLAQISGCSGFNHNNVIGVRNAVKYPSKVGSLQRMLPIKESTSDYGTMCFDKEEVHKIAIFDLHIVNMDRNDQNILVKRKPDSRLLDFFPIDHGFCLPDCLALDLFDAAWLEWSQSKSPLSKKSRDYIRSIDIEKDVTKLKHLGIEDKAILVFRLMNICLKKCAEKSLTVYQMAQICMRNQKSELSVLELITVYALWQTIRQTKHIEKDKQTGCSKANRKFKLHRASSLDNLKNAREQPGTDCFEAVDRLEKRAFKANLHTTKKNAKILWRKRYLELTDWCDGSMFFTLAGRMMDLVIHRSVLVNRNVAGENF